MDDQEKRALLEAHWERHANAGDFDESHAIYHEDAVLEWPQSGERFAGKATLRAMRESGPPLRFRTWRIIGSGDVWTAENLMAVADGEPQMCVSILEFRGDKIIRETVYITQPFEAASNAEHSLSCSTSRACRGAVSSRAGLLDSVRLVYGR